MTVIDAMLIGFLLGFIPSFVMDSIFNSVQQKKRIAFLEYCLAVIFKEHFNQGEKK